VAAPYREDVYDYPCNPKSSRNSFRKTNPQGNPGLAGANIARAFAALSADQRAELLATLIPALSKSELHLAQTLAGGASPVSGDKSHSRFRKPRHPHANGYENAGKFELLHSYLRFYL
jgi:hypothetical protein